MVAAIQVNVPYARVTRANILRAQFHPSTLSLGFQRTRHSGEKDSSDTVISLHQNNQIRFFRALKTLLYGWG